MTCAICGKPRPIARIRWCDECLERLYQAVHGAVLPNLRDNPLP